MSKEITIEQIQARCEEVANCWIWQGGKSQTGYPIVKKPGGPCVLVRRLVAELNGKAPAPRQPVITTCGEKCCCNPAHVKLSTPQKVGQAAAAAGSFGSIDRRAKIARAKRASPHAKLNMEKARAIRSSEKSSALLAVDYGVNLSLIKKIRAGKAWCDYSSPFAGLGARA